MPRRSWYRHRADGNQKEIVKALRADGCGVVVLSQVGGGCPDLIVSYNGNTWLMEIKRDKGELSEAQLKFRDGWRGEIRTVRTVDEALAAVRRPSALRERA